MAGQWPPLSADQAFQTNRQDIHALILAIADSYIAYCIANSVVNGIVRAKWHALPETLDGEGPFVYLSEIRERITNSAEGYGVRVTEFTGGLGYVDVLSDPMETDDRVNAFSDYMRDYFTANARTLGRGLLTEEDAEDRPDLTQGTTPYAHFMVNWKFAIQEGRTLTP